MEEAHNFIMPDMQELVPHCGTLTHTKSLVAEVLKSVT